MSDEHVQVRDRGRGEGVHAGTLARDAARPTPRSKDVVLESCAIVPPVTTMYFMGALEFISRGASGLSAHRLFRRRALFAVGDTRFGDAGGGAAERVAGTRERRLGSSCT
jgi:hypothetical protein